MNIVIARHPLTLELIKVLGYNFSNVACVIKLLHSEIYKVTGEEEYMTVS